MRKNRPKMAKITKMALFWIPRGLGPNFLDILASPNDIYMIKY